MRVKFRISSKHVTHVLRMPAPPSASTSTSAGVATRLRKERWVHAPLYDPFFTGCHCTLATSLLEYGTFDDFQLHIHFLPCARGSIDHFLLALMLCSFALSVALLLSDGMFIDAYLALWTSRRSVPSPFKWSFTFAFWSFGPPLACSLITFAFGKQTSFFFVATVARVLPAICFDDSGRGTKWRQSL